MDKKTPTCRNGPGRTTHDSNRARLNHDLLVRCSYCHGTVCPLGSMGMCVSTESLNKNQEEKQKKQKEQESKYAGI